MSSPEFKYLEFQERLQRVVDLLVRRGNWQQDENVRRHLHHGLVRRLFMLEHGLRVIDELPEDGSEPLPHHRVEEVNSAINSAYLNIRGALDNAAWALVYHFDLVDEPSERVNKHRALANLWAPKFLKALRPNDAELADALEPLAEWGRELARFRDPAAHRIPLYVAPSIVDEGEAEEIRSHDGQMAEAIARGDWDAYHEHLAERSSVGRFRHILGLSEQQGLRLVSLPALLNRDLGGLLDSLELVVSYVFAEGEAPLSSNVEPLPRRPSTKPHWR